MTAILAMNLGDRVTVLSDTAMLHSNGVVGAFVSKANVTANGEAIISEIGFSVARRMIAHIEQQGRPFKGAQDLIDRFAVEMSIYFYDVWQPSALRTGTDASDVGNFRCVIATLIDKPEIHMVYGPSDPNSPDDAAPFQLYDTSALSGEARWLRLEGPPAGMSEKFSEWVTQRSQGTDLPDALAVELFDFWRGIRAYEDSSTGERIYGIGGSLEALTLCSSGVSRRLIKDWPDDEWRRIEARSDAGWSGTLPSRLLLGIERGERNRLIAQLEGEKTPILHGQPVSVTGIAKGGTAASTPAQARTNLGLQIGTDVMAYDAQLAALAGLTGAAGSFVRWTGANTAVMEAIVGTVSQSSGVPTGAIVERGGNANGEYVRFADGTQICTGVVTPSNTVTATGGGFQGNALTTWTYPASFQAPPVVSVGSLFGGGSVRAWISLGSLGTSSVQAITHSFTAGGAASAQLIAIGKWF